MIALSPKHIARIYEVDQIRTTQILMYLANINVQKKYGSQKTLFPKNGTHE